MRYILLVMLGACIAGLVYAWLGFIIIGMLALMMIEALVFLWTEIWSER